ncbi:MAG TPA: hypothetical protein DCY13_14575 [Verrucomicrobiales bacterium]|nr:hypothetical protein [Verrucomicrobiales bacterium]
MISHRLLLLAAGVAGTAGTLPANDAADPLASPYGTDRFGNAPPASFTYAFPSAIRLGDTALGDIDSAEFAASYVESVGGGRDWHWLVGANWRRQQFDPPASAPLPDTLQAAAAAVGANWRINNRWRARVELLPGVYSDFRDVSGDDVNVPALIEGAYRFNDNLEVGVQLNVDAFRESPIVGTVGVSWRFADDWRLALWIPRPQIEYTIDDQWAAFVGASFGGGSYRVADDFGKDAGRADLGGEVVDFQEVRVGAGVRYIALERLAIELAGGWMIDRRFHFHERDVLVNGDGAPYIQFSLGAVW